MASKTSKNKKQIKPERKNNRLRGLQIAVIIISAIIVLSMVLSLFQI
jgi:predicted nucleic acid-binding Zn ribbon protein